MGDSKRILIAIVTICFVAVSCGKKESPSPPVAPVQEKEQRLQQAVEENNKRLEEFRFEQLRKQEKYQQLPLRSFPSKLVLTLLEENEHAFDEPIVVEFQRDGNLWGKHIYTFQKSYLGEQDDSSFFGLFESDDIEWEVPWPVISVDMKSMTVIAGTDAGKGVYIGDVYNDGSRLRLDLLANYQILAAEKKIVMNGSDLPPQTFAIKCHTVIEKVGACPVYIGIFETLASIDFTAFGKAGPGIFSDVVSIETILKLTLSILRYSPDVDTIRTEYLVPLLKAMSQLRKWSQSQQGGSEYVEETRQVYSNFLITAIDTGLKTQKMIPDAINPKNAGFGILLGYIGADRAGEAFIGASQPPWFTQIVAPVIREVAEVLVDTVLNNSEASLKERIGRVLETEARVRDAVLRLCKESNSSQNECMAALN